MVQPPHWLTDKGIDQLVSAEYDTIRKEIMSILATEEKKAAPPASKLQHLPSLPVVMGRTWATGGLWYTLGLSSPSGLFTTFKEHIRPLFCRDYTEEFNLIMAFFWEKNVGYIAGCKLSDEGKYDVELQEAFADVPN